MFTTVFTLRHLNKEVQELKLLLEDKDKLITHKLNEISQQAELILKIGTDNIDGILKRAESEKTNKAYDVIEG